MSNRRFNSQVTYGVDAKKHKEAQGLSAKPAGTQRTKNGTGRKGWGLDPVTGEFPAVKGLKVGSSDLPTVNKTKQAKLRGTKGWDL